MKNIELQNEDFNLRKLAPVVGGVLKFGSELSGGDGDEVHLKVVIGEVLVIQLMRVRRMRMKMAVRWLGIEWS